MNSIKFTPEHGSIHLHARRAGNMAEIVVCDTGRGIGGDFLPFIFEPFRQAETPASANQGLGLGLSIVKQLVEAHGGTIVVSSEGAGKGSTFTVHLPLANP